MTVIEKFQGVCANPAWLTLASAFTFGPANLPVMLCVLIRMLEDIEPGRLHAVVSRASERAERVASHAITARATALRLVGTMVFIPPARTPAHTTRTGVATRPRSVNKSQVAAGRFTAGHRRASLAFGYRNA